jgi:AcrR family transcriptional regulator
MILETFNHLYIKNPEETSLGRRILTESISLIYEIGFEEFNFKKLASTTKSTETSIYRYFENKHQLLVYLVSTYWESMLFNIKVNTKNINEKRVKLQKVIETVVKSQQTDMMINSFDQVKLHSIVVENGSKVSHNKKVDELNRMGAFIGYKEVIEFISVLIIDIDPLFKYPKSIATAIVEMSMNNEFYALHLPRLTDEKTVSVTVAQEEAYQMVMYMIDRMIFRSVH